MKNTNSNNKLRIFLHLLAWTIMLVLPYYVVNRWEVGKDFIWLFYINVLIGGFIFYSNYLLLVPRYFFSGRKYKYYTAVFLVLAFFFLVSDRANQLTFKYISEKEGNERIIDNDSDRGNQGYPGPVDRDPQRSKEPRPPGPPFMRDRPYWQFHLANYISNSLFLIFLSLGLKVLERHSLTEKLQKELEKEKLNSELAFLKNQISPHFFFNTLNNIYSLIGINPDDSQKAVLKLSKLMRYLLYESEQGNTSLGNEIEFMNNYIDLMKLRMSDKVDLRVDFTPKYHEIRIPALLFIPFIENAFKHGISYRGKSFIHVSLDADSESIRFVCENSTVDKSSEMQDDHSGIGLENVVKRLNLIFPARHNLDVKREEGKFRVDLYIRHTS